MHLARVIRVRYAFFYLENMLFNSMIILAGTYPHLT